MTTPREKAASVAKANEVVMAMLEAFPDEGNAYEWEQWMAAARYAVQRCQQIDGKAAQRLQLVVAAQWLGHAADHLDETTDIEPGSALDSALRYLRNLGDWLANGTSGDEPKP
jgi:hypothetical protein